jgi:RNA polymerase sigma-70 factor (ECF subfamily)
MLERGRDAALYVPERGAVRAWAAEAAHRRAVDRLRSGPEGSSPERSGPERIALERRTQPDAERSGERPADHGEDARSAEARDCLRSLPEDERAALVMTYFEGRTCADVAAELGAPVPAVASRLATALRHVTRCLGLA